MAVILDNNGNFTFSTALDDGLNFNVSVLTQLSSPNLTCSVINGSGTLTGTDITNIMINCVTETYTIGGTVSGLASGNNVVLQNNAGDDLIISADGSFTFASALVDLSTYNVSILTQPTLPNQLCMVNNGSGSLMGADVSNIEINCITSQYDVNISATGLALSNSVSLVNGSDILTLISDGTGTISNLPDGSNYAVSVLVQPETPNQFCTVTNGSGVIAGSDVSIAVNCVTDVYTVSGTVSGLASGHSLVLQNNGGDDLTVNTDGNFTFSTALIDGSSYEISVLTEPTMPNQTCTISNPMGVLIGANVTNIFINCITNQYNVNISATGLAATNSVGLTNGSDFLTLTSNGTATISTLDDGSSYSVNVLIQPETPNQICTVSNGSGTLSGADATNVSVNCVTTKYTIGGTVSGMINGNQLVLQNNMSDDLNVLSNGNFTFTTALDDESAYQISVLTNPTSPNQTCTVTNGSGILAGNNITDVSLNCTTTQYDVNVSISGLATSNSVSITNGTDSILVTSNSTQTLSTLDDGSHYNVSITDQPTTPNQTCNFTNDSSGIINGEDAPVINISCVTENYFIGGTVSGLLNDNFMVIQNNGGDDEIIMSNGTYIFDTPLLDQSKYSVEIFMPAENPIQPCKISNGESSLAGDSVDDVDINCDIGSDLIHKNGFESTEAFSKNGLYYLQR